MFLTRKSLKKIRLLTGAYIVIGPLFLLTWLVQYSLQMQKPYQLVLGFLSPLFGCLVNKAMRYSEGKGKLILRGHTLIYRELRPAEFIRCYEEARTNPDNVLVAPDVDVLVMLSVAYESLSMKNALLTVTEWICRAAPKKKALQMLILKAAALYNCGRNKEAEEIYRYVSSQPLNVAAKTSLDILLRSDRALAYGDYATAEAHYLTHPTYQKLPLLILLRHYQLAKICLATGRPQEAVPYLQYCIEHGGETSYPVNAAAMLKEVNV